MAGSNSAFNPATFRTVIRQTMTMGLPTATADRATFRWITEKTFAKTDARGRPYDFAASPTSVESHEDVQVPVAVEFSGASISRTSYDMAGEVDATRVIITILDEDYELVRGANFCLLGENTYKINFVAPPIGLFEVTVYQLYATAQDEA